jgi:diguanylate cyclase (GGDEF)-like protein/PAS domain S-box-containing protein
VRLDRRSFALLAVPAVAGALVAAGALYRQARTGTLTYVEVCLFAAVGTAATAACLLRGWRSQDRRLPWLLLAAAAALEVAGRSSWWIASASHDHLPMPATGPLVHAAAMGVAALGLLSLRVPPVDRAALRRTALDAATIAVAVVVVATSEVFARADAASVTARAFAGVVTAADIAVAVMGLVALSCARYAGGTSLRSLLPVCAGIVAVAAGSAGTTGLALAGNLTPGTPVEFIVTGGLLLLGAGAAVGQGSDGLAAMPRRERIAVCAAVAPVVLAALAVVGYQLTEGRLPVTLAIAVMTLAGLLLARLILALLDNLVLSRTLESQVAERTLEIVTREQWFRSLIQHSSDVVTVVDATGTVRYQSPSVQRLFGYDPAELVGTPLAGLLRSADLARLNAVFSRAHASPGSTYVLEFPMAHRDGSWRDTETVVTNLLHVPDVQGLVLNTRDVTDRKQLQERLTHQAYFDALTGLANREMFQHELADALVDATSGTVAVLFCDLDGFKAVNDSQGHDMGDALLRVVADRLRRCVRPTDLVARFGGDEFAVLVRDENAMAAAREVAQRMTESLAAPIALDGRQALVGVSIGIAVLAPEATTTEVLLRNADLAMYRAKADRHQSVVVFETAMHEALLARLRVEDELRVALGTGQLVLHYQPTVRLSTGVTVGVEALMRWYHPERGVVAPHEFIAIAEDNGFIEAMGRWALFEACRQAAEWQPYAAPGTCFSVGVNISARQVTPELVDLVAAALTQAGIPPAALLLEMTESVLLGRTEEAVEVLRALKRLGVRIAIDDFGTGFSSLSYLSRFPVDVLKIDKNFIDEVDRAGERAELARTIVGLGRSLQVATIAEGIERQGQANALRSMGCEFGQGYLFSRPLPGTGVTELLQITFATGAVAEPGERIIVAS